jgi:hypothetical protein
MDRAEATSILRWEQRPDRSSCLLQALFDGRCVTRVEATTAAKKMNRVFPYVCADWRPVRVAMSKARKPDLCWFEPHSELCSRCRLQVTGRRETPDSLSVAAG